MIIPKISYLINTSFGNSEGTRGSVVGSGTMLQAGRSRVRFPMRSLDFSIYLIWTMALGSTQPLTEMSTRNLPGGKGRPASEQCLRGDCVT
jgi:hypothetical protein